MHARHLLGLMILALLGMTQQAVAWQMESGVAVVRGSGTVAFTTPFAETPLVFAISDAGRGQPDGLVISNISRTGFDLILRHATGARSNRAAAIQFFAIEPGVHQLPLVGGGFTLIEAGSLEISEILAADGGGAGRVDFVTDFGVPPAILTNVQTRRNEFTGALGFAPWMTATALGVDAVSATLGVEGSEVNPGLALPEAETLGYVAMAEGVGEFFTSDGLFSVGYQARPSGNEAIAGYSDVTPPAACTNLPLADLYTITLAAKTTRNAADGGWIERCVSPPGTVGLVIEEDREADSERSHLLDDDRASVIAFDRVFTASFGLVADYHFDDCELSVSRLVEDSAPYGLNAVGTALATVDVFGAARPGPLCQAAGLQDDASIVRRADHPRLDIQGPISAAAWINPTPPGTGAFQTIVAKSNDAYRLLLEPVCVATLPIGTQFADPLAAQFGCEDGVYGVTGDLVTRAWKYVARFEIQVNGTDPNPPLPVPPLFVRSAPYGVGVTWDGSGEVTPENWQHVAGTYNGTELRVYVGNEVKGTTPAGLTFVPVNANDRDLTIGATESSLDGSIIDRFSGSIDEVTVWSSPSGTRPAPSGDPVQEHYLRQRECEACKPSLIFWRERYHRT